MNNFKNEFENCGFFKIENFIDKSLIKKIIGEINSVKNNIDIYYDQKGGLRRIERLYDKGESLKFVNKKSRNGQTMTTQAGMQAPLRSCM